MSKCINPACENRIQGLKRSYTRCRQCKAEEWIHPIINISHLGKKKPKEIPKKVCEMPGCQILLPHTSGQRKWCPEHSEQLRLQRGREKMKKRYAARKNNTTTPGSN